MSHINIPSLITPRLYKCHPLWPLRRLILINAIVGFVFSFLTLLSTRADTASVWACGTFAMVFSAKIAVFDLCVWVKKKHEEELTIVREVQTRAICRRCEEAMDAVTLHADRTADENETPEHKTVWPVKWLMVVEFFLTLALIWLWFCELAVTLNRSYYYANGSVLMAYA
ncbi:hypothetical protein LTR70_010256, partial [Exophiala xenobiotica]